MPKQQHRMYPWKRIPGLLVHRQHVFEEDTVLTYTIVKAVPIV